MPPSDTAQRPARYKDLYDLPDNVVGEILGGEVVATPRPGGAHAVAASSLSGLLVPPFQFGNGGPGGWWILVEPELHLGDEVLVPDLGGWRRDRMPDTPSAPYFTLSPDWVCEIHSPGSARIDRVRKVPSYASAGVGHLWLVDPRERTLEVFRLEDQRWVLVRTHGGDERIRAEPFQDVELSLEWVWGETGTD